MSHLSVVISKAVTFLRHLEDVLPLPQKTEKLHLSVYCILLLNGKEGEKKVCHKIYGDCYQYFTYFTFYKTAGFINCRLGLLNLGLILG